MLGQAEQMELAAMRRRDASHRGAMSGFAVVTITASSGSSEGACALLGPFVTRYPELELELPADVRPPEPARR